MREGGQVPASETLDYEAEYNNRARVPEHPQIIAAWERDAAAYREAAPCELDLAYGDTARSRLDLFHPEREAPEAPLCVFIHGGYWQALDRKAFSHMARGPNGRGLAVAVPSYDLCPETTVGAIIEQMHRCCLWLWRHTGRPLVVFGHSAGGHLTAAMLASDWPALEPRAPRRLVSAGVPISGLFELEPLCGTSINQALGLTPEMARAASPLFWPAPDGTRLVAYVGANESTEYHRQSETLCERWGNEGVDARCAGVAGANHFTVVDGLADPADEMVETLAAMAGARAAG